jgi:hypothetical protein
VQKAGVFGLVEGGVTAEFAGVEDPRPDVEVGQNGGKQINTNGGRCANK